MKKPIPLPFNSMSVTVISVKRHRNQYGEFLEQRGNSTRFIIRTSQPITDDFLDFLKMAEGVIGIEKNQPDQFQLHISQPQSADEICQWFFNNWNRFI